MTNEAKDQVPEWARTAAAKIAAEAIELHTDQEIEGLSQDVAAALLSAYRRGVEDSAKVASGQPYLERYRTWPWWKMPDGVGNRANESEIVRHSDDIAAAIRRLGEAE